MSNAIDVSDKTKFAMPIRNLISLIASVGVGVWAYFGIIERLNNVETNYILMQADVEKNSTFSRDWPLGRAGSLPQDSEQYMLIEFISKELTQLKHNIETGKAPYDQQQALTLEFYEKRINGLESKMEKLKDEVAELKASNGH
tara:strand:- start:242 stop:670 length:429 start_codon:yes stop_codon:yes gene_type:complete